MARSSLRTISGCGLLLVLLVAPWADGRAATPSLEGKRGGTLVQLGGSDVDFVDPGMTYYTGGYQLAYPTHRPLYSFKPGQVDPVPDLAEGAPEISPDAKTVTVRLRSGVRFSPPVNREVTSDDVKYAFERFMSKQVGGQYPSYFEVIVGTPASYTDRAKNISGIQTPDARTIVFKLKRAAGTAFASSLVLPITMPVPRDYAKPFDAKNPSTYNTHVVATGPYMVKNDAQGNLTGYKAGRSIAIVRNPNWDAATDYKPAYLDAINWTTNAADATRATKRVLSGSRMSLDAPPPASELRDVTTNHDGQSQQVSSGGWRYFPMNTTIKPLDNLNVRKAIIAAFNRDAARKVHGGALGGDIPTHYLPPGMPGFEEAGGFKGPGYDFMSYPRGNLALAHRYMRKAGYASGRYTGKARLLIAAADADPGKAQARVVRAQLQKLGFKVRLRVVPQDSVYNDYCQVPAKKVAICGSAGWFKDFTDPESMLEQPFSGNQIYSTFNNNLSQLYVPSITAAMRKAATLTGADRIRAWADIDRKVTAQAPGVPFLWDTATLIWSKDVNGIVNEYSSTVDFAFTSLK